MASGHVNRTNRPNTWLHRPATRRNRSRPHMAHSVESLWCEGSDAIGAKRTCRERRPKPGLWTANLFLDALTRSGVMVWAVFSNTVAGPGFLAGDYFGASGEATVGAGVGANVLLGGSNRTVALQPISLSTTAIETRTGNCRPHVSRHFGKAFIPAGLTGHHTGRKNCRRPWTPVER